jgi:hypothetical protein
MVKERMAIRKDEALLSMCQRIFGEGIVSMAYITTWDYGNSTEDEIKGRLHADTHTDDGSLQISCDAETIIIELVNGRRVVFSNSEWATICAPDVETYET